MRYKELDSLRGLAALLVVFFHYTLWRSEAELGFKLGTTGVDLFFIISGFVIYFSLDRISESKKFIANRISRLYPTYWSCVTITFAAILIHSMCTQNFEDINLKQFMGNMTMFQFYLNITDLDNPYWTMIIEMLFYVFMLFMFHFKLLKYINFIGVLLSSIIVVLVRFYFDFSWVYKPFYFLPFLQFFPLFFAGILFYKLIVNRGQSWYYFLLTFCLICQILLFLELLH